MKLLRKIFFSVFILSFLSPYCKSQEQRADSLQSLLLNTKQDTSKVKLLNELFTEYEFNEPEKAKDYLHQAFEIAISLGYKKGLAECYTNLGYLAQDRSNSELAILNYNEALKIFKELKDKNGISKCYNNIGISHFEYSEYSKALEYFFKGLKISEELGDKAQMSAKLGNIGSVYLRQNDYPKALEYYFKALKMDEELGDRSEVAKDLGNIGIAYTHMEQHQKALEYYTQAEKIEESTDNKDGIATQLDNIGIAYSDIAETYKTGSAAYDSLLKIALAHHRQALKLNEELGNQNRMASCYNNIATVYYDMYNASKKDSLLENVVKYLSYALKINEETGNIHGVAMNLGNIGEIYCASKQYAKAEEYLQKTLSVALKYDFRETRSHTYWQLSELYEKINQPEKAVLYYKQHTALKDSIFNETKSRQIAEMQTKFEVDKKEKELTLFKQQQRLATYKAYFLAVVLALVSLLAVVLINRQRIKIKKQKEAHELEQQLAKNQLERNKLEKENLEANLLINKEKLNHITDLFKEKSRLMDKMEEQLDKVKIENIEEKGVKQLLTSIEEHIDPNEYWEEFITSFNLVNKNFFDQILKLFPELTRNELRLCALIKCNLGNKEIANMLNITPDSVKKSRNRLRKRLQLEADNSLTEYIQFLN